MYSFSLQQAAEAGDKESQYRLARAYYDGDGVQQNRPASLRWFRRAAYQGHSDAHVMMGWFYLGNRGLLARNEMEALLYFEAAANAGDKRGAEYAVDVHETLLREASPQSEEAQFHHQQIIYYSRWGATLLSDKCQQKLRELGIAFEITKSQPSTTVIKPLNLGALGIQAQRTVTQERKESNSEALEVLARENQRLKHELAQWQQCDEILQERKHDLHRKEKEFERLLQSPHRQTPQVLDQQLQDIAQLKQTLAHEQEKLGNQQLQLTVQQEQLRDTEEELNLEKRQLATREQTLKSNEQSWTLAMQQAKTQLEQQQREQNSRLNELQNSQADYQQLSECYRQLHQQLDQLHTEKTDKEQQIQTLERSTTTLTREQQHNLDQLRQELAQKQRELSQLQGSLQSYEAQLQVKETRYLNAQQQLETTQQALHTAQHTVSQYEDRISSLGHAFEQLRSKHHEAEKKLDNAKRLEELARLAKQEVVKLMAETQDSKRLLQHAVKQTEKENGTSPLLVAVWDKDSGKVKKLLEMGYDVQFVDESGQTALHIAVQQGALKLVKLLLDKGSNPNVQNKVGKTPLHVALQQPLSKVDITQQRAHIIDALLQAKSVNVSLLDQQQRSALHYAALQGDADTVDKLVKRRVRTNGQDSLDKKPYELVGKTHKKLRDKLHHAAVEHDNQYKGLHQLPLLLQPDSLSESDKEKIIKKLQALHEQLREFDVLCQRTRRSNPEQQSFIDDIERDYQSVYAWLYQTPMPTVLTERLPTQLQQDEAVLLNYWQAADKKRTALQQSIQQQHKAKSSEQNDAQLHVLREQQQANTDWGGFCNFALKLVMDTQTLLTLDVEALQAARVLYLSRFPEVEQKQAIEPVLPALSDSTHAERVAELRQRAKACQQDGQVQTEIHIRLQIEHAKPQDMKNIQRLADLYVKQAKFDKAEAYYRKLPVKVAQQKLKALVDLSDAQRQQHVLQQQLHAVEQLLHAGDICLNTAPQQAEHYYWQAFQQLPEDPQSHDARVLITYGIGLALMSQQQWEEAYTLFDELLRLDKGSAEAYYQQACIRGQQQRMGEALAQLGMALWLAPDYTQAKAYQTELLTQQAPHLAQQLNTIDDAISRQRAAFVIKSSLAAHITPDTDETQQCRQVIEQLRQPHYMIVPNNLQLDYLKQQQEALDIQLNTLKQAAHQQPLLNQRIAVLEHNQALLVEEYQRRERIQMEQHYIQQRPAVNAFYRQFQKKLLELLLACKVVNSHMVERQDDQTNTALQTASSVADKVSEVADSGLITLGGTVLDIFVPGAGTAVRIGAKVVSFAAQGASYGAKGLEKAHNKREEIRINRVSDFAVNVAELEAVVEETARLLALRYTEQLQMLTTAKKIKGIKQLGAKLDLVEGSENGGAEDLAECAVVRVLDALRLDKVQVEQPLPPQLVNEVFKADHKHGGLLFFKNKVIEVDEEKLVPTTKWRANGIFQHTGIKSTNGSGYALYKNPKKGLCSKPEKYGYRLGTDAEKDELQLTLVPLTGLAPLIGARKDKQPKPEFGVSTQSAVLELKVESKKFEEKIELQSVQQHLQLAQQQRQFEQQQQQVAEQAQTIQSLQQQLQTMQAFLEQVVTATQKKETKETDASSSRLAHTFFFSRAQPGDDRDETEEKAQPLTPSYVSGSKKKGD